MDIKRRTRQDEIKILARELSRIAGRNIKFQFVRDMFERLIQNRLLQKLLTGDYANINLRDLKDLRVKYEDRLKGIDKAGILKRLLPKTDQQLIDEIDRTYTLDEKEDITYTGKKVKDLFLLRDELKRRINLNPYNTKLNEAYEEITAELYENEELGQIILEYGDIQEAIPAKPEQFETYPELYEGNININLLTDDEEKYYKSLSQGLTKTELDAEYMLRATEFTDASLEDLITQLRESQRTEFKAATRDIAIKILGTIIINNISKYMPYINIIEKLKNDPRFRYKAGGITATAYIGKLFYNYYTSQPGAEIQGDLTKERGHVFNINHNYNGPGTKLESRFELDEKEQGKYPYIYPSSLLDIIALEHDLLYTTPNKEVQQYADLRYVENVANPEKFLMELNEKTNNKLFDPKNLKNIIQAFKSDKINYISAGFIKGQSISRTIENPLKLQRLYEDLTQPSESLIELLKPNEITRRYGINLEKMQKATIPKKYNKYINDAEKVFNNILNLMSDGGELDNNGEYVITKQYNKDKFKKDLQTTHNNFNELVREQRKVDNEDINNVNRYRLLKIEPSKIDNFLKKFNNEVNVEIPIKQENNIFISTDNIIKDKMVVQHYDSIYSHLNEITNDQRKLEMTRLYQEGQKLLEGTGKKELTAPKSLYGEKGMTKKQYETAYKRLQNELIKRDVPQSKIEMLDDAADKRQTEAVKNIYKSLDDAGKKKMIQKITQTREKDNNANLPVKQKEQPTSSPEDEKRATSSPEDAPKEEKKSNIFRPVLPETKTNIFTSEPVEMIRKKEQQKQEERAIMTANTQNKENPDNMVEVRRLTQKAVDKVLNPTAQEKRRMNAGFYDFLTPSDQNGGIGTAKTNPLIRQNERHEKMMTKGNLSSYYDNTILDNNNNLLFKRTYNIPEIKREIKTRRDYPKNKRGLIRKYPAYMPPQIQQIKEFNDFQPSINPPSNYYKGSRYNNFYRSIPQPLPYEEYVRRFYANPNQFTAGADFY